jgi:hypothetical protein
LLSSFAAIEKKEKTTTSPRLVIFWQRMRKKQEDDNKPISSSLYVGAHEENKLKDNKELGGSSSSFNLLLQCPKPNQKINVEQLSLSSSFDRNTKEIKR